MFRGITNRRLSSSLFLEPTLIKQSDLGSCLYTLRSKKALNAAFPTGEIVSTGSGVGAASAESTHTLVIPTSSLTSAYDTYLELEDITGYKWAKTYLESYDHFEHLMGLDWFRTEVEAWNKEILAAKKAAALNEVFELREAASDATRLSASKYILEEGWKPKKTTRGRPSKAEVAGEVKKAARKVTEVSRDAERIGLTVIPGGK